MRGNADITAVVLYRGLCDGNAARDRGNLLLQLFSRGESDD